MSTADPPRRRPGARSIVLFWLALTVAVVYVALPASGGVELIRVFAPTVACCGIVLGIARHRPESRLPWALLALSSGLLTVAHMWWAARFFDGEETFPTPVQGFHLAAALAMLGAAVLFSRNSETVRDGSRVLESVIAWIAVGACIWLVVVEPYLSDRNLGLARTVWAAAVPAVGGVALVAVARAASNEGFIEFAPVVVAIGFALQVTADALRGVLELRDDFAAGGVVAALGVAAPLLIAVAASDSTMSPCGRRVTSAMALTIGRMVVLSVTVTGPFAMLLGLLVGDRGSSTTRVVLGVCSVVSVVLALARLWSLTAAVRRLTERRGQDRLAAIVEHASDVVMLVDAAGHIQYASPGLVGTLGHRSADWTGRPFFELVDEADREVTEAHFGRVIDDGHETVKFESSLVRVDGEQRRMEATIANLLGGDAVDGIVATFRDVTEQRKLERQLSHRAFHDELTGLANRALFLDRMDHALRVSRPDHDPVVVLFVDLDDFKSVNDALGHGVGDQLLRTIADRIRSAVGAGDTPARLGGDEFAVLLEDRGGVDRAIDVAHQLLDVLRQTVQLGGYDFTVHASVGVAVAAPGMTTSSLLRDADIAMYEAKRAGKGQIKIFDPAMRLGATTQLEYRSELGSALDNGELRLVYQPLVSLHTGDVTGAEALLRWRHPVRGDVSPAEFVPIAERSRLILPIGSWVLHEAMREARLWQERGSRYVSINVSAVQLRSEGFVDVVQDALTTSGLEPANVLLEVTETLLVEEIESASSVLSELRELGIRIAIDDFGTGYCSLSYLHRFPIDILKIDRQFVDEVDGDAKRSSLARIILQMSDALEITSVAEGIERPAQLAALRRLGCDTGQGFLLSRPLEVEALHERFGIADRSSAYASAHG